MPMSNRQENSGDFGQELARFTRDVESARGQIAALLSYR